MYEEMNKAKFTRNAFGIQVKKCCASCAFKVLTTRRYRGCRRHQRKVLPTMVCRDWMISNVFQLKNQQTTTKK